MDAVPMLLTAIVICLLVGAVAGLLGGLLGVGGGLIIVPALVWIYRAFSFPEQSLMQFAIATSLATILFTGASSVRAHQRRGAVRWDLVKWLAPALMAGAFAGSQIADALGSERLMLLFGIFAALLALHMLVAKNSDAGTGAGTDAGEQTTAQTERQPPVIVHGVAGLLIGFASALFGIGGGSLTVPYLSVLRVRMQQAVASSSACGIPIAVAGAAGFMLAGWGRADLPAGSLGYVHLPSLAAIAVASIPLAMVGAKLAHRLPAVQLRRIFALVLLLVAADFLFEG